mmetsp:Transcript_45302/g.144176  ORF Transcript_45302/g.144176 Transcript_45302/m.144176 type:complete len:290 (-) Transcript_45302:31-900(-)
MRMILSASSRTHKAAVAFSGRWKPEVGSAPPPLSQKACSSQAPPPGSVMRQRLPPASPLGCSRETMDAACSGWCRSPTMWRRVRAAKDTSNAPGPVHLEDARVVLRGLRSSSRGLRSSSVQTATGLVLHLLPVHFPASRGAWSHCRAVELSIVMACTALFPMAKGSGASTVIPSGLYTRSMKCQGSIRCSLCARTSSCQHAASVTVLVPGPTACERKFTTPPRVSCSFLERDRYAMSATSMCPTSHHAAAGASAASASSTGKSAVSAMVKLPLSLSGTWRLQCTRAVPV